MNIGEATVFSQLTKSVAKVCAQINGVCVLVARKVTGGALASAARAQLKLELFWQTHRNPHY